MKAYLDSSVVLRVVIGQANRLDAWDEIEHAVTSALTEVECLRTLDRLRLRGGIDASALAVRREAVYRLLGAMEVVEIGRAVLARAGQPYSTPLGTLDAVHLSTALLWADHSDTPPVIATHDKELAIAARGSGLAVVGC